MTLTSTPVRAPNVDAELPASIERCGTIAWERIALLLMVVGPFAALALGTVLLVVAGRGPSLLDVSLGIALYLVTGHGVTVGFHRYLTHGGFTCGRGMRLALSIAGSMAIEGAVIGWVAAHRRHHQHADREGDPHSPWRYGTSTWALARGLWWAQVGWLFSHDGTRREHYCPDLVADRDLVLVDRLFPLWAGLSLLAPAAVGALATGSWFGALSGFLWAGLVRVGLLHHVTWSVNSICHAFGSRPFTTRDQARNVWPLAVLSMGESWHNWHHAEPRCARHGVEPGQLDSSARLIAILERTRLVTAVRWPQRQRVEARRRG
ncbi:MAG TPA: acyl-CoA desaturase [Mycobacteriales bacterium]|jgi:stearoyl-CoA desaturase (delta-9 desaturase)|nr:acyl-CoA desaturase [Mycobacteriales bacterium]